ncbi:hypothetical protein EQG49_06315 [Periweissella cryptocerci]|uniref:LPXTG cell wall anchor domain-containing protein n=1 Tax=Periweissella cryptocerci TaxID=2506420 RepID=A0A4P6YTS7_9LACO|nr:SpaA isopeptide-forming pilin-related protein [Periweissella cryptocerci]QBO36096.1 hypothetical protein EQG49_06315 [Periweissella cryptocerci]
MKMFSRMANLFSTAVIVGQIVVSGIGGVVQAAETTEASTPVTTIVAPAASKDATSEVATTSSSVASSVESSSSAPATSTSLISGSQTSTSESTSTAKKSPVKAAKSVTATSSSDDNAKNDAKVQDITDQFDLPKGSKVIEHADGSLTVTLPAGADFTSSMKAQFAKYNQVDVETKDADRAGQDITTLAGAEGLPIADGHPTLFTTATLKTADGKNLTADNPIKLGDKLTLAYSFDLPDELRKNMVAGDYFNFDIPAELKTTTDISIPLSQGNTQFATLTLAAGSTTGKITFTDAVKSLTQISGFANMSLVINDKVITKPGTPTIVIPYVKGPISVTPTVVMENGALVEKQFTKNTATFPANPMLTWKITINENLAALTGGKLTEALPQATSKFTVDKIVEADVDLSGKITEGTTDVKSQFTVSGISGDYKAPTATVTLPASTNKAYVMYVTTEIDQMSILENNLSSNFTNKATMNATVNGKNVSLPASATTTLAQKYQPMVTKTNAAFKTGATPGTGTVDWTIKFNPDNLPLPAASAGLTDTYGTNDKVKQSIKNGTFVIKPSSGGTPLVAGTDYQITESGTGINITFLKDVNQALDITYTTAVTGVAPGVDVSNGLKWKNAESVSHATVTGSGIVKKWNEDTVNLANHTVDWTIDVNAAKAPLLNWKVTDTLGNSTYTDLSKLTVKDVTTGKVLTRDTDYTLTDNGGSFVITYSKPTSDAFQIAYQAQWALGQKQTNTALYDYATVDGDGEIKANTDFKPLDMPKTEIDKSGSYASPKDKTITWTVDWNTQKWHTVDGKNQIPMGKDVKITDTVSDDQEYVAGSARLVASDGSSTAGLVSYDDATKTLTVTGDKLDGSIAIYTLTYQTKAVAAKNTLPGTDVVNALPGNEITNTAHYHDVKGDIPQDTDVTASLPATTVESFVQKTGAVDNSKASLAGAPFINWILDVNPDDLFLQNVMIKDDNWQNIQLVAGTIKVTDASGKTVPSSEYTLDTAQQYFVLHFVNDVTKNYKVTYQTNTPGLNSDPGTGWTATNDVNITGDNIIQGLPPLTKNIKVTTPDNFGGAKGLYYDLNVTKKGARTKKVLAGAEFSLYNKDNQLVNKATTGIDGVAHFTHLLPGDYVIKETQAPKGYSTGDDVPVTLGAKGDSTTKQVTYTDTEFGDLIVTKADSVYNQIGLLGATYALLDSKGNPVYVPKLDADGDDPLVVNGKQVYETDEDGNPVPMVATTDENGQLTFKKIASGNYQLKEITAPDDYQLNTTNVKVIFSTSAVLQTPQLVTDVLKTGQVTLTKTDFKNNNQPVSGAVYTLQNQAGKVIMQADGKTPVTGTTDKDGNLIITDIAPGDYQLVETTAPKNYLLDAIPQKFTIVRSQAVPAVPHIDVTDKQIPGSVAFTKLDAQTDLPVEGAIFKLVDENGDAIVDNDGNTVAPTDSDADTNVLPDTYTTDAKGQITVANLTPGDYKFIEVTPADGYVMDDTPQSFTIVPSQAKSLMMKMYNQETPGTVELTKTDAQTGDPVDGALFKVIATGDETKTAITDIDGTKLINLETKNGGKLYVGNLLPGKYSLIETKAPSGYELDTTAVDFEVKLNQVGTIKVTKTNAETPGSVVLTKVDAQTGASGAAFDGVEFKLLDATGEPAKDAQGNLIDTPLITKDGGQLTVNNLLPGEYQFVETKAPVGYDLSDKPVKFKIEFNQETTADVEFANQETPGTVILTKTDAQTKQVIAGAEFKVFDADNKIVIDATGAELKDLLTDEAGQLKITTLFPGDYQLVETKAAPGYILDETPIDFVIDFNQTDAVKKTMTNEETPGSVVLTKTDAQTKQIIAGAQFKVVDQDNNVVTNVKGTELQDLTTNENGQIQVDNLLPGKYSFIETKAVTGYVLDETPVDFEISLNQAESTQVTKTNAETPGSVQLMKTDAQTGKAVANAEFKLVDENGELATDASGKQLATFTTDKTGKIVVDNLLPGNYSFVEVKAPAGYDLDKTPVKVNVAFDQQTPAQVAMTNNQTAGSVVLTKRDSKTKATLANAVFELRNTTGVIKRGLKTNSHGQLKVDDLLPGKYTFVETKAPKGYVLSKKAVKFTIVFNQETAVQVTKLNKLVKVSKVLGRKHTNRKTPTNKMPNDKTPNDKTPNGKTPNGKTPTDKTPKVTGDGNDGDKPNRNAKPKHAAKRGTVNETHPSTPAERKAELARLNSYTQLTTLQRARLAELKTQVAKDDALAEAKRQAEGKLGANNQRKIQQTGFENGINWLGVIGGVSLLSLAVWQLRRKQ